MSILATLGAAYMALGGLAYLAQGAMMYPAPRRAREPHAQGLKLLRIPGRDGRTVFALFAPSPPGAPTIVHFHGNGEQLADVVPLILSFRKHGVGMLAVEYPGYGLAHAYRTSERDIYADAESALDHAQTALGVCTADRVLMGYSLGSGIAAEMAARRLGKRLVLISPMTSMVDMARLVAPIFPVRFLVRDRYDTLGKTRDIRVPTLIVHGTRDEVIPAWMGRRLSRSLLDVRFEALDGAGHSDVFWVGKEALVRRIVEFASGG